MSVLLVFGCLASCFSVETFAYATPQKNVPLAGGSFSIWWTSDYNGEGVSKGTMANDTGHTMTITEWSSTKNSGDGPRKPKLEAFKIAFDENMHLTGGYDYMLNVAALPGNGVKAKFNQYNGPVSCSFYDQYNNLVWTYDFYTSGLEYEQNGFIYCIMRDLPVSLDFKYLFMRFDTTGTGGYDVDGVFGLGSTPSWLQLTQLEKGVDSGDVVKAIRDQTAADQNRYDDFISPGGQQGPDAIDSTQQFVSEKIGILDFAEGVLSDFIGLFSADPGDATLTLPGFKWHDLDTDTDLTVWEPQTFDFAFVEEHFGPLVSAMRVGTVLAVYGALLWYLQAVFERIFGGGDGN